MLSAMKRIRNFWILPLIEVIRIKKQSFRIKDDFYVQNIKEYNYRRIRMNHELDYDRDYDSEDELSKKSLKQNLQMSLERENEMMKTYLIMAERIHDNEELQNRLRNFAEGNAKRSRQLMDEIKNNV